ncbi:hypothetical protein PanWU01x14_304870 [Parasponia andersonii]|uniref:Uncharacterized protein n=1 Tax=Parasponia andersonii TaxID=3476 RepID=A0A2P5ASE8_PARAD|nr:hypothetical protein PanWU01x14_304870 [Parasponia andersonii]
MAITLPPKKKQRKTCSGVVGEIPVLCECSSDRQQTLLAREYSRELRDHGGASRLKSLRPCETTAAKRAQALQDHCRDASSGRVRQRRRCELKQCETTAARW